ncbi:hypothetical protein [Mycoplasmopsis cynos]|uniref:hypothetical protein n=1 Tax=Mycoplasmopsis cynos TaxID=171284 RepID=UPI00220855A3|nr:hypothetical protein [Mycoplasmopsis cynos]UWV82312.1 hypothetical protein NW067_04865 [Mycoplasmopsis cynos]
MFKKSWYKFRYYWDGSASNNGVDEVRFLKEKIEQAPINGKYSLYHRWSAYDE